MAELKDNRQTNIEIDEVHVFQIDTAVYNWLNQTKSITINERKVPVLFGAWERFAQMQGNKNDDNLNAVRDKNGMLKLPIISIRRESIEPLEQRYVSTDSDGFPYITFQREIAHSKFDNRRVPYTEKWFDGWRYKTTAPVYELCSLPFPKFIRVPYVITFWASYIKHANQFHDLIWMNYRPGDINFKGYFFYSNIESSSDESNTEDFSTEERIIRHSFMLNVEAYLIDKKNIKINRSTSKFLFEETLVDLDDMQEETILNDF